VRNNVMALNATHDHLEGNAVTEEVHHRLSAALRAQASVVSPGSPVGPAPRPRPGSAVSTGRGPAHAQPRLSGSALLALAVLFGAMAGGLAGVISAW
jgi:hypothetical protein